MKYIDADCLRKVVEEKYNSNDTVGDRWDLGYDTACEQILDIIDSLQQEQLEADIEREINDFLLNNSEFLIKGDSKVVVQKLARHFAQWGAEHLKEDKK